MSTNVDLFMKHVDIIKSSGFQIVSDITKQEGQIEISFDDGYLEHLNFVLPELININVTGIFSVPLSNFIGNKEILDINRQRENILSKSHISKQEYEKLDTSINVTEDTNCLLALETMLQNRRTYLPVIRNSNNDSNTAIDIITFELIMEYILYIRAMVD